MLCVDEKSQIQALDRTLPGLPLKKGRVATITHDDKRHGTTTLFAALDVKSGKVIGDCMPRHRAKEFLKFLRQIDKAVPARRDVHLVPDNYSTHKTPEVRAWLDKHPRFKLHFTPTSASWLNLVERFFAEITSRRIRRGNYSSVDDLEAAVHDLSRAAQRDAQALQVDKERRGHPCPRTPRTGRAGSNPGKQVGNVRLRTLGLNGGFGEFRKVLSHRQRKTAILPICGQLSNDTNGQSGPS